MLARKLDGSPPIIPSNTAAFRPSSAVLTDIPLGQSSSSFGKISDSKQPFADLAALRKKMEDFLASEGQTILTVAQLAVLHVYLESGISGVSAVDRPGLAQTLQVVSSPQCIGIMKLSYTETQAIRGVISTLAAPSPEFLDELKPLSGIAREVNQISAREQTFRDRAYLIDAHDVDVQLIVQKLLSDGTISLHQSTLDIANAVLSYVQQNFHYDAEANSVNGVPKDTWQSIRETILKGGGDCEDTAILQASILMNVLERKGYSSDQVHDMVTLSAGFMLDENPAQKMAGIGHAVVKLKDAETGSTFALDATGTSKAMLFSRFGMDEVFEMNDTRFVKYQEISSEFTTALQLGNVGPQSAMAAVLGVQADIRTELKKNLEVPEFIRGSITRSPAYQRYSDKTGLKYVIGDSLSAAQYNALRAAGENMATFAPGGVVSGQMRFFNIEKKDLGMGAISSVSTDQTYYTIQINPAEFAKFFTVMRDNINKMMTLFLIQLSYSQQLLSWSLELGIQTDEDKKIADSRRKDNEEYSQKIQSSLNKYYQKINTGVQDLLDQVLTFVRSGNQIQFDGLRTRIERYGLENPGTGILSELVNEYTGAMDLVRAEALQKVAMAQFNIAVYNSEQMAIYADKIGDEMVLMSATQSRDSGPNIWQSRKVQRSLWDLFNAPGNEDKFSMLTIKSQLVNTVAKIEVLGQLKNNNLNVNQVDSLLSHSEPTVGKFANVELFTGSSSRVSPAYGVTGSERTYVDLNVERMTVFKTYLNGFYNMVRILLMIQQSIADRKSEAIEQTTDVKQGSKGIRSAAQDAVVTEMNKHSSVVDSLNAGINQVTKAANSLVKSKADWQKAIVRLVIKTARIAANIAIAVYSTTQGIIAGIAASIAFGVPIPAPPFLIPNIPMGLATSLAVKTGTGAQLGWGLNVAYTLADMGLEMGTMEYTNPTLMQNSSTFNDARTQGAFLARQAQGVSSSGWMKKLFDSNSMKMISGGIDAEFYNARSLYSRVDSNGKPIYIEKRGDGMYSLNGLKQAAAESQMIEAQQRYQYFLTVLHSLQTTLGQAIEGFGLRAASSYGTFDSIGEASLMNEKTIIQAYQAEIQTSYESWQQNANKAKAIYDLQYQLYYAYGDWLITGLGFILFTGASAMGLAETGLEFVKMAGRYSFGDFAGMLASYHNRSLTGSDTDPLTERGMITDFNEINPATLHMNSASDKAGVYAILGSGVPGVEGVSQTYRNRTMNSAMLQPLAVMVWADRQERYLLGQSYINKWDTNNNRMGGITSSVEDAAARAFGGDFRQVNYDTVLKIQEQYKQIVSIRNIMAMVVQSLLTTNANALKELSGMRGSSAATTYLLSMADQYNQYQSTLLEQFVKQYQSIADSYNADYGAKLQMVIESVGLIGFITGFITANPVTAGNSSPQLEDAEKGIAKGTTLLTKSQKASLYRTVTTALAKSIVGAIGLATVRKAPVMASTFFNTEGLARDKDELNRIDQEKDKVNKDPKLTSDQKTSKIKELNAQRSKLKIQMAVKSQISKYNINPGQSISGGGVQIIGGGTAAVSQAGFEIAKTEFKRQMRGIKVLMDIMLSQSEMMTDAYQGAAGMEGAKAYLNIRKLMSDMENRTTKQMDQLYEGQQAQATAMNRSLDMIRQGVSALVAHFVVKNIVDYVLSKFQTQKDVMASGAGANSAAQTTTTATTGTSSEPTRTDKGKAETSQKKMAEFVSAHKKQISLIISHFIAQAIANAFVRAAANDKVSNVDSGFDSGGADNGDVGASGIAFPTEPGSESGFAPGDVATLENSNLDMSIEAANQTVQRKVIADMKQTYRFVAQQIKSMVSAQFAKGLEEELTTKVKAHFDSIQAPVAREAAATSLAADVDADTSQREASLADSNADAQSRVASVSAGATVSPPVSVSAPIMPAVPSTPLGEMRSGDSAPVPPPTTASVVSATTGSAVLLPQAAPHKPVVSDQQRVALSRQESVAAYKAAYAKAHGLNPSGVPNLGKLGKMFNNYALQKVESMTRKYGPKTTDVNDLGPIYNGLKTFGSPIARPAGYIVNATEAVYDAVKTGVGAVVATVALGIGVTISTPGALIRKGLSAAFEGTRIGNAVKDANKRLSNWYSSAKGKMPNFISTPLSMVGAVTGGVWDLLTGKSLAKDGFKDGSFWGNAGDSVKSYWSQSWDYTKVLGLQFGLMLRSTNEERTAFAEKSAKGLSDSSATGGAAASLRNMAGRVNETLSPIDWAWNAAWGKKGASEGLTQLRDAFGMAGTALASPIMNPIEAMRGKDRAGSGTGSGQGTVDAPVPLPSVLPSAPALAGGDDKASVYELDAALPAGGEDDSLSINGGAQADLLEELRLERARMGGRSADTSTSADAAGTRVTALGQSAAPVTFVAPLPNQEVGPQTSVMHRSNVAVANETAAGKANAPIDTSDSQNKTASKLARMGARAWNGMTEIFSTYIFQEVYRGSQAKVDGSLGSDQSRGESGLLNIKRAAGSQLEDAAKARKELEASLPTTVESVDDKVKFEKYKAAVEREGYLLASQHSLSALTANVAEAMIGPAPVLRDDYVRTGGDLNAKNKDGVRLFEAITLPDGTVVLDLRPDSGVTGAQARTVYSMTESELAAATGSNNAALLLKSHAFSFQNTTTKFDSVLEMAAAGKTTLMQSQASYAKSRESVGTVIAQKGADIAQGMAEKADLQVQLDKAVTADQQARLQKMIADKDVSIAAAEGEKKVAEARQEGLMVLEQDFLRLDQGYVALNANLQQAVGKISSVELFGRSDDKLVLRRDLETALASATAPSGGSQDRSQVAFDLVVELQNSKALNAAGRVTNPDRVKGALWDRVVNGSISPEQAKKLEDAILRNTVNRDRVSLLTEMTAGRANGLTITDEYIAAESELRTMKAAYSIGQDDALKRFMDSLEGNQSLYNQGFGQAVLGIEGLQGAVRSGAITHGLTVEAARSMTQSAWFGGAVGGLVGLFNEKAGQKVGQFASMVHGAVYDRGVLGNTVGRLFSNEYLSDHGGIRVALGGEVEGNLFDLKLARNERDMGLNSGETANRFMDLTRTSVSEGYSRFSSLSDATSLQQNPFGVMGLVSVLRGIANQDGPTNEQQKKDAMAAYMAVGKKTGEISTTIARMVMKGQEAEAARFFWTLVSAQAKQFSNEGHDDIIEKLGSAILQDLASHDVKHAGTDRPVTNVFGIFSHALSSQRDLTNDPTNTRVYERMMQGAMTSIQRFQDADDQNVSRGTNPLVFTDAQYNKSFLMTMLAGQEGRDLDLVRGGGIGAAFGRSDLYDDNALADALAQRFRDRMMAGTEAGSTFMNMSTSYMNKSLGEFSDPDKKILLQSLAMDAQGYSAQQKSEIFTQLATAAKGDGDTALAARYTKLAEQGVGERDRKQAAVEGTDKSRAQAAEALRRVAASGDIKLTDDEKSKALSAVGAAAASAAAAGAAMAGKSFVPISLKIDGVTDDLTRVLGTGPQYRTTAPTADSRLARQLKADATLVTGGKLAPEKLFADFNRMLSSPEYSEKRGQGGTDSVLKRQAIIELSAMREQIADAIASAASKQMSGMGVTTFGADTAEMGAFLGRVIQGVTPETKDETKQFVSELASTLSGTAAGDWMKSVVAGLERDHLGFASEGTSLSALATSTNPNIPQLVKDQAEVLAHLKLGLEPASDSAAEQTRLNAERTKAIQLNAYVNSLRAQAPNSMGGITQGSLYDLMVSRPEALAQLAIQMHTLDGDSDNAPFFTNTQKDKGTTDPLKAYLPDLFAQLPESVRQAAANNYLAALGDQIAEMSTLDGSARNSARPITKSLQDFYAKTQDAFKKTTPTLMTRAVPSLARSMTPAKVIENITSLQRSPERQQLANAYLREWVTSDPAKAVAFLSDLSGLAPAVGVTAERAIQGLQVSLQNPADRAKVNAFLSSPAVMTAFPVVGAVSPGVAEALQDLRALSAVAERESVVTSTGSTPLAQGTLVLGDPALRLSDGDKQAILDLVFVAGAPAPSPDNIRTSLQPLIAGELDLAKRATFEAARDALIATFPVQPGVQRANVAEVLRSVVPNRTQASVDNQAKLLDKMFPVVNGSPKKYATLEEMGDALKSSLLSVRLEALNELKASSVAPNPALDGLILKMGQGQALTVADLDGLGLPPVELEGIKAKLLFVATNLGLDISTLVGLHVADSLSTIGDTAFNAFATKFLAQVKTDSSKVGTLGKDFYELTPQNQALFLTEVQSRLPLVDVNLVPMLAYSVPFELPAPLSVAASVTGSIENLVTWARVSGMQDTDAAGITREVMANIKPADQARLMVAYRSSPGNAGGDDVAVLAAVTPLIQAQVAAYLKPIQQRKELYSDVLRVNSSSAAPVSFTQRVTPAEQLSIMTQLSSALKVDESKKLGMFADIKAISDDLKKLALENHDTLDQASPGWALKDQMLGQLILSHQGMFESLIGKDEFARLNNPPFGSLGGNVGQGLLNKITLLDKVAKALNERTGQKENARQLFEATGFLSVALVHQQVVGVLPDPGAPGGVSAGALKEFLTLTVGKPYTADDTTQPYLQSRELMAVLKKDVPFNRLMALLDASGVSETVKINLMNRLKPVTGIDSPEHRAQVDQVMSFLPQTPKEMGQVIGGSGFSLDAQATMLASVRDRFGGNDATGYAFMFDVISGMPKPAAGWGAFWTKLVDRGLFPGSEAAVELARTRLSGDYSVEGFDRVTSFNAALTALPTPVFAGGASGESLFIQEIHQQLSASGAKEAVSDKFNSILRDGTYTSAEKLAGVLDLVDFMADRKLLTPALRDQLRARLADPTLVSDDDKLGAAAAFVRGPIQTDIETNYNGRTAISIQFKDLLADPLMSADEKLTRVAAFMTDATTVNLFAGEARRNPGAYFEMLNGASSDTEASQRKVELVFNRVGIPLNPLAGMAPAPNVQVAAVQDDNASVAPVGGGLAGGPPALSVDDYALPPLDADVDDENLSMVGMGGALGDDNESMLGMADGLPGARPPVGVAGAPGEGRLDKANAYLVFKHLQQHPGDMTELRDPEKMRDVLDISANARGSFEPLASAFAGSAVFRQILVDDLGSGNAETATNARSLLERLADYPHVVADLLVAAVSNQLGKNPPDVGMAADILNTTILGKDFISMGAQRVRLPEIAKDVFKQLDLAHQDAQGDPTPAYLGFTAGLDLNGAQSGVVNALQYGPAPQGQGGVVLSTDDRALTAASARFTSYDALMNDVYASGQAGASLDPNASISSATGASIAAAAAAVQPGVGSLLSLQGDELSVRLGQLSHVLGTEPDPIKRRALLDDLTQLAPGSATESVLDQLEKKATTPAQVKACLDIRSHFYKDMQGRLTEVAGSVNKKKNKTFFSDSTSLNNFLRLVDTRGKYLTREQKITLMTDLTKVGNKSRGAIRVIVKAVNEQFKVHGTESPAEIAEKSKVKFDILRGLMTDYDSSRFVFEALYVKTANVGSKRYVKGLDDLNIPPDLKPGEPADTVEGKLKKQAREQYEKVIDHIIMYHTPKPGSKLNAMIYPAVHSDLMFCCKMSQYEWTGELLDNDKALDYSAALKPKYGDPSRALRYVWICMADNEIDDTYVKAFKENLHYAINVEGRNNLRQARDNFVRLLLHTVRLHAKMGRPVEKFYEMINTLDAAFENSGVGAFDDIVPESHFDPDINKKQGASEALLATLEKAGHIVRVGERVYTTEKFDPDKPLFTAKDLVSPSSPWKDLRDKCPNFAKGGLDGGPEQADEKIRQRLMGMMPIEALGQDMVRESKAIAMPAGGGKAATDIQSYLTTMEAKDTQERILNSLTSSAGDKAAAQAEIARLDTKLASSALRDVKTSGDLRRYGELRAQIAGHKAFLAGKPKPSVVQKTVTEGEIARKEAMLSHPDLVAAKATLDKFEAAEKKVKDELQASGHLETDPDNGAVYPSAKYNPVTPMENGGGLSALAAEGDPVKRAKLEAKVRRAIHYRPNVDRINYAVIRWDYGLMYDSSDYVMQEGLKRTGMPDKAQLLRRAMTPGTKENRMLPWLMTAFTKAAIMPRSQPFPPVNLLRDLMVMASPEFIVDLMGKVDIQARKQMVQMLYDVLKETPLDSIRGIGGYSELQAKDVMTRLYAQIPTTGSPAEIHAGTPEYVRDTLMFFNDVDPTVFRHTFALQPQTVQDNALHLFDQMGFDYRGDVVASSTHAPGAKFPVAQVRILESLSTAPLPTTNWSFESTLAGKLGPILSADPLLEQIPLSAYPGTPDQQQKAQQQDDQERLGKKVMALMEPDSAGNPGYSFLDIVNGVKAYDRSAKALAKVGTEPMSFAFIRSLNSAASAEKVMDSATGVARPLTTAEYVHRADTQLYPKVVQDDASSMNEAVPVPDYSREVRDNALLQGFRILTTEMQESKKRNSYDRPLAWHELGTLQSLLKGEVPVARPVAASGPDDNDSILGFPMGGAPAGLDAISLSGIPDDEDNLSILGAPSLVGGESPEVVDTRAHLEAMEALIRAGGEIGRDFLDHRDEIQRNLDASPDDFRRQMEGFLRRGNGVIGIANGRLEQSMGPVPRLREPLP